MADSSFWLPESARELVCLNSLELENLDIQVFISNNIVNWLNGRLDTGLLIDVLLEYNINPSILDEFEKYIKYVGKPC